MTNILIHGAPSLPSVWSSLLPRLGQDARALELPYLDAPQLVEHLVDHCAALPGPLTLVGHSSGACLALHVASRIPDRVRRVVCLSGCAEVSAEFGLEMKGFADALESGDLDLSAASEIATQRWLPGEERSAYGDTVREMFKELGGPRTIRALRQIWEMSLLPGLPSKSVAEVVVVHGTTDQAVPLSAARVAERSAISYREVLVDTASHLLQWTHPEVVAASTR